MILVPFQPTQGTEKGQKKYNTASSRSETLADTRQLFYACILNARMVKPAARNRLLKGTHHHYTRHRLCVQNGGHDNGYNSSYLSFQNIKHICTSRVEISLQHIKK